MSFISYSATFSCAASQTRAKALTWALENKSDNVGLVLGTDGDAVVVCRALQNLVHADHVDAQADVTIAAVRVEAVRL